MKLKPNSEMVVDFVPHRVVFVDALTETFFFFFFRWKCVIVILRYLVFQNSSLVGLFQHQMFISICLRFGFGFDLFWMENVQLDV